MNQEQKLRGYARALGWQLRRAKREAAEALSRAKINPTDDAVAQWLRGAAAVASRRTRR